MTDPDHTLLQRHYEQMYQRSIVPLRNGKYSTDPLLASSNDRRFGLTLLLRPSEEVKQTIQRFLDEIRKTEPEQYYYPVTDIHVTVMSIISCYEGFHLGQVNIAPYTELIGKALAGAAPFQLRFRGITLSPEAVMICGYPGNEQLAFIRHKLRQLFKATYLFSSIDKRYAISTAHSTVMRYKAPLKDASRLAHLLEQYKEHDFGTTEIKQIEFVYNDWYQRLRNVLLLNRFTLGAPFP